MIILNPKIELLEQGDNIVSHVARCARVCYDKETGNNDERLYNDLIKRKHFSVFRHVSYYAIVPADNMYSRTHMTTMCERYLSCPYISIKYHNSAYYIATNGNFVLDNKGAVIYDILNRYQVSPEEFANTEVGHSMMRYTFKIITQISTSRELNRVSPNNITELSSRYVDLKNGTICRPHWMTEEEANDWNKGNYSLLKQATCYYAIQCASVFESYEELINEYNFKREDARGVLPLDTATKVIYTYSIEEWTDIINKRVNMITGRAHENAKIVINMVKSELEGLGYEFK